MISIYLEKPEDLIIDCQVSTVLVEFEGKALFLKRVSPKDVMTKWAIPGGKLEAAKSPLSTLLREIKEELNLDAPKKEIEFLQSFYIQKSSVAYKLHFFRWQISNKPILKLNPQEHSDYVWLKLSSIETLPLLEGQKEVIELIISSL